MATAVLPSQFGTDIACITDADAQWSTVDGINLVLQDLIHRITTDDILGDNGVGWGYDVRKLLGMYSTDIEAEGPKIAEAIQRDERIDTVDVVLTPVTNKGNLVDVTLTISGTTALGPFKFTRNVSQLTTTDMTSEAL